jgi:hypothetical protein
VQAASRPYALAAAALAAVSAVVVTPVMARQVPLAVRAMETKLVGIDDIPINLFDDILSIPYNELEGGGLASVADSFLFTGTWWVPSSTNLWGIDPGDPSHIALIDNFLPFTAFTDGFTNSAGVYEPGLNYEFDGLLAAELPFSSSCDAETCFPMTPPEVITGSTPLDRDIGFFETLIGKSGNTLFSNFYKVPISDLLHGYTFDSTDPSGAVNPETGLGLTALGNSGNPFEGGTGANDAVPWDGLTYKLNLLQPLETFYESLTQAPATDGVAGTGVEVPTIEGVAHTFENLFAGMIIDFDPFTEGSPACPAACTGVVTPAQLVADISKLDPSNTTLSTWVTDYNINPALVNEPTQPDIDASVALLQTGEYNLTGQELLDVDKLLYEINPELPQLLTNMGIYTDPDYVAYATNGATTYIDPSTGLTESVTTATGDLNTAYGGFDYWNVPGDLIKLFTSPTDWSILGNSEDMWFLADPLSSPDPLNSGAVGGGTNTYGDWLTKLFDGGVSTAPNPVESPAASAAADSSGLLANLHAELAALVASMGATAGADATGATGGALADMFGQLSADLATWFPNLF